MLLDVYGVLISYAQLRSFVVSKNISSLCPCGVNHVITSKEHQLTDPMIDYFLTML